MLNKNTENNLKKLSTDYIYNQSLCSILLLLLSSCDDVTGESIRIPFQIHQDILDVKEYIKTSIINLEKDLNGGVEVRTNKLTQTLELKRKVMEIYENYFAYYSELSVVSTMVNDEMALRKYKEENLENKTVDFASFYTDIIDFIQKSQPEDRPNVISQVAKCINLNITRDKYFDIIKNSLYHTFDGHSKGSIDFSLKTLKFTCCPQDNENYGKYFPEICEYLKTTKQLKLSELSDTELDEQMSDFDNMFEVMEDLDEYFKCLYNDVNALSIIYYSNYSFQELEETAFIISDIYHACCEFLADPENELLKEIYESRTYELLEKNIEQLIDKANSINKEEFAIIDKIQDFSVLEEDTQKILASEGFVRASFYEVINEEVFSFGGDIFTSPASMEYKEEKFNEFIEIISDSLSKLNNKARKSTMQLFMMSLPLAIDTFEFMDFVRLAIESAPSFEHKLLMVDKVGMIFESSGFVTDDHHDHSHSHSHTHVCDENCTHS